MPQWIAFQDTKEMIMYMYEQEDYVPLNWDKLITDSEVWITIQDEMDSKFSADCLMKIITKAKERGMKDKDIFMPIKPEMEEEDDEEEKEEYVSVFESTIEDTTKDL
jgi:hypothetical protein